MSERADLRKLLDAASPAPWRRHDTWLDRGGYTAVVIRNDQTQPWSVAWLPTWSADPSDYSRLNSWADAELIAEMRNALPALLDAAAIVRDLAEHPPARSFDADCQHCGTDLHWAGNDPERHHESCPWRRAREWVSTQETDDV